MGTAFDGAFEKGAIVKHWIAALTVAAVALAGTFGMTHTASAAKPEPFTIELDCGEDGTLEVALGPGNGTFTPVKIVGGGMLIPVAFSNQHGTFTDNGGHTEEFNEPDVSKAGPTKGNFVNCHFEIVFNDENGTGSFEGDVKAFIAPR